MFSLNLVTKIFVITVKGFEPATSCARAPARHMWDTGSLNWPQFMLHWSIRFPKFSEFLFHLERTVQRHLKFHTVNVYENNSRRRLIQ